MANYKNSIDWSNAKSLTAFMKDKGYKTCHFRPWTRKNEDGTEEPTLYIQFDDDKLDKTKRAAVAAKAVEAVFNGEAVLLDDFQVAEVPDEAVPGRVFFLVATTGPKDVITFTVD